MGDKKICFVVQGFGEKTDYTDGRKLNLDASYQVIKEAVEEAGLECIRADEIQHSGTIDQPMYEQLLTADLVIADLSTYNVNAVYELGIRYGLRPQATIIVAEQQFNNPFDVSHMVIRRYEHLGKDMGYGEVQRFKKELKQAITEIVATQKVDSPVYTFLQQLQPPVMSSERPPAGQPAEAVATRISEVSVEQLPGIHLSRDTLVVSVGCVLRTKACGVRPAGSTKVRRTHPTDLSRLKWVASTVKVVYCF